MKIEINHSCADFDSYRAARVKSLFNCESGATFDLSADLPIDDDRWSIGVVVGPSGSGKSSIGDAVFGRSAVWRPRWPADAPIIDAIAPAAEFDTVPAALSAVGLGSVPAWLRPHRVLSNGEQFRANLARLVAERPRRAVVDEFTSVVDRQIAKVGAMAFAKAWRRGAGQVVLLSCHYDVLDWIEPDWIFDTAAGAFERAEAGRCLRRRPPIAMDLWETDRRHWPAFEPHHYLKLPDMIAATYYVATVDGAPVAHVAVGTRPGLVEARACRLVVMPEWQGAGIGVRFLNAVYDRWLRGENRHGIKVPTLFHRLMLVGQKWLGAEVLAALCLAGHEVAAVAGRVGAGGHRPDRRRARALLCVPPRSPPGASGRYRLPPEPAAAPPRPGCGPLDDPYA